MFNSSRPLMVGASIPARIVFGARPQAVVELMLLIYRQSSSREWGWRAGV